MAGSGASHPKFTTRNAGTGIPIVPVDGGKWRTTEVIDLTHSILDGLRGSPQRKANQRWLPKAAQIAQKGSASLQVRGRERPAVRNNKIGW
eukprot:4875293-Amphidinium_carterae.1